MSVRTLSLVIMLGQGITEASGIAVAILLVRIVDQATFGSYRRVLLVFTTLAALLSLQLDQSLCYFVPKLAARAARPDSRYRHGPRPRRVGGDARRLCVLNIRLRRND